MRVTVLLSMGGHPASGRPRLAPGEAAALSLARGLAATLPGGCIGALHAGPAANAGPLRAALGLGAARLDLLAIGPNEDPLPALAAALATEPARLVLTGSAAETGLGSGTLPYALAEMLGWPLAEAVTALAAAQAGTVDLLCAESGGRRRRLRQPLPAIVVVRPDAAPPGLAALGPMRRGTVGIRPAEAVPDLAAAWDLRPARRRPRRLDRSPAAEASAGAAIQSPQTPAEAADLILDFLRNEGLLRAPQPADESKP
jgi:electron transfer flavoprotein beta subunit